MAYPNSSNHWCKVCLEENRKARYDAVKMRNKNLQRTYHGFTNTQYDALFLEQGGKCAVCEKQQKQHLHVYHDHGKGRVRGLLCSDCNTALGHLHDSPIIISRLLQYALQYVEQE